MSRPLQWPQVDLRTGSSLVYAAVAMILIHYLGKPAHAAMLFPEALAAHAGDPARFEFYGKTWWTLSGVAVYFLVPWCLIHLGGGRLRDHGVRLPSSYGHLWIYGVMLAGVVIIAYFASFQPAFLEVYPYYRHFEESPWLFGLFWAGRAVRFFALEFFFRGYLLFSLQPRFGDAAFFVSMVPYCMLHFGKPLPETVFALFGGIIFCWIAARTKSIWGAVVLHVALAVAMDGFAIAQKLGYL